MWSVISAPQNWLRMLGIASRGAVFHGAEDAVPSQQPDRMCSQYVRHQPVRYPAARPSRIGNVVSHSNVKNQWVVVASVNKTQTLAVDPR